jgi:NitT/TauT family transport system permease protein
MKATFIGTAIGLAIGVLAGAVLSDNPRLAQVMAPFITMMNSIPRIALIPIVVLIVGPTLEASVISSVLVVTFIVFFNALQGGRSVSQTVLQNARLLGANRRQIMFRVRFPYVLMWTFAALPNAIAFGLLTVVTAELLTGSIGMGNLIFSATTNVDATLSFAVVVILSFVGVTIVALTEQLKRRLLHWAD